MNNGSSSNGIIIGIIILILIVVVGWLAYSQGWMDSKQEESGGIQLNIGGASNEAK